MKFKSFVLIFVISILFGVTSSNATLIRRDIIDPGDQLGFYDTINDGVTYLDPLLSGQYGYNWYGIQSGWSNYGDYSWQFASQSVPQTLITSAGGVYAFETFMGETHNQEHRKFLAASGDTYAHTALYYQMTGESGVVSTYIDAKNRWLPQEGGLLYTTDTWTQPVPEPTTMLLLGSGLIGLAGFRRRFRKR